MPAAHAPIGDNLARIRKKRALTQEALAERAGTSVDLIKKLEQNQRRGARISTLEALAGALNVTLSDLTRSARPVPRAARPAPAGTTISGMAPDDPAIIRSTSAHLIALDTAHGSTGLDQVATRTFAAARRDLARSPGPGRDLAEAVAGLGQVTAWLLHDAGRDQAARSMLSEALVLASTAGTNPHRAELMIVDQLSMLAIWRRDWAEGLRLAERGLAHAKGNSPRVAAMYGLRRARALALAGSRNALDELRRALALIDDGVRDDDPPWLWWLDRPQLLIHQAHVHSELGEHCRAVELAHSAVAALNPKLRRNAATFRAALLRVTAMAGAWDDLLNAATQLAPILPAAGSARAVNMVTSVATNLPASTPTKVADILRDLLSGLHRHETDRGQSVPPPAAHDLQG